MKTATKLLAILLSFALTICVIPQTVLAQIGEVFGVAASDSALSQSEFDAISEKSPESCEVYTIGEMVEERTATTKTFRMSDGTFVTADYGKQVHFIDEYGEYTDYNNLLVFDEKRILDGEEDFAGYENQNSNIKIKLANNSNSSNLLKIASDKYKISIKLVGADESKRLEIYNQSPKPDGNNIDAVVVLDKYASGAVYKDILPFTDIEYLISGSSVKENIVVKAKSDSYIYVFELKLNGLTPVVAEDDSIVFKDEESGEAAFTVPAGYMYDANGNSSSNITYKIEAQNGKKYRLTVTADASWINEKDRAFPVTIDPTVEALTTSGNIYDTYVSSEYPTSNYYNLDKVISGYYGNETKECHALITTAALPQLPKSAAIVDARLYVYHMDTEYDTKVRIAAKEITSTWDSTTVTWNTKPTYGSTILDYVSVDETTEGKHVAFDVTNLAQAWYSGTKTMHGIALCPVSGYGNGRIYFGSSDYVGEIFPHLLITYRDTKGLESIWTYSSHSVGGSDTGYINGFNGNLVFAHHDMSTKGSILPVEISHIYNGYLAGKEFTANSSDTFAPKTANFADMKVGRGWKLSVQETLVFRIINGTSWYIYTDADGTELYFYYSQADGKWISEDGYDLYVLSSNSNYRIVDDYGNTKTFDSSGRLIKIEDAYGNKKNINYTDNQLTSISHTPAGSSTPTTHITLKYSSYKYLERITNSFDSSDYITFGYTTGRLTKVAHSKGSVVTYSYNSDGTLSGATNLDTNYAVNYTYTSGDAYKKVAKITESVNGTQGQTLTYDYKTKFFAERNSGKDDVHGNSDDINTVYTFDNFGKTICSYVTNHSYSKLYGAYNAQYNNTTPGSKLNNKVLTESSTGVTNYNFLPNGSFEGTSDWSASVSGSGSASVVTAQHFGGLKAVKLSTSSTTSSVTYSKNVNLAYSGTYTLSAYVKADSVSGTGASIVFDGAESSALKGTTPASINNGWQRISVSKTITAAGNYTISLNLKNASGSVYFDCVKLERSTAIPSNYNYIENSSFADSSVWGNNVTSYGHVTRQHVGKVTGDPSSLKQSSQTIEINMPSTTTFVLSGWAFANSVDIIPEGDTNSINDGKRNRTFGMKAVVIYSDNTDETHTLKFNPDYTDWQFGSIAIIPKKQSSTLKVSKIRVYLLYDYNANYALFDDLALTVEPAQAYGYDSNGKLEAITDPAGNKSSIDYATNKIDVEGITSPNGEEYNYTYGTEHQVLTATKNCGGITQTLSYGYNAFGNITSVALGASGTTETISSSATYSTDGQYLTETIDSLGGITKYNYDSVTKLISYVDAANNTRTAYAYDTRKRIQTVYVDYNKNGVKDTIDPAIEYLYANNRLSQITSATTDYTLTYDIFGNLLTVKAGESTLATYTYGANNGKLHSLTYGNGKYETYEYDALDRLVEVYYNGSTTPTYSVEYDPNGRIYSITDNGIKHIYEYDGLNRLIRAWQYTTSGALKLAVENSYDNLGRAVGSNLAVGNVTQSYEIIYNDNSNRVDGMILPNNSGVSSSISYFYDAFDRVTRKITIVSGTNASANIQESFTYKANSSLVASQTVVINGGAATTYSYTYDAMGNILTVKKNGATVYTYCYNATNQLASVADAAAGYTYLYSYDSAGNIAAEYVFNYTTASAPLLGGMLGSAIDANVYTYSSADWQDKLTNYNGKSITYDAAGNPTKWRNASSITWDGRNLGTYYLGSSSVGIENTYNSSGIRTKKYYFDTVNDKAYNINYVVDGSRIISASHINVSPAANVYTLTFIYDEKGNVVGFTNRNEYYIYQKNIQGDIVGIIDKNGNVVVEYTYDSWGKLLSTTGSLASTIGEYNPFRYRSYCYDIETGIYYVSSRYYDPEIGRFISPDTTDILTATPMGLTDKNLFAYCDNNPVVRVDRNGQFWDYVVDIGFLAWSVADVVNDPDDWKNWAALAVDVVFAVVPFVPSGVGQVIKVGNKIDNALDVANAINKVDNVQNVAKVTMIGRNMDRVTNTANLIGKADNLYEAWKGYDATATGMKRLLHNGISMAHNGGWLFGKLRQGYTVIDIGLSTMHKGRGLWYGTERVVLGLWETRNIWKLPINYDF